MDKITRVGVDLAKRVIQVHAVDAGERVVIASAISRERFEAWCAQLPAGCIVAMQACSSAHHWARRLQGLGLSPRLIAAQFVSPYRMETLVAVANKNTRILWAVLARGRTFDAHHVSSPPYTATT